MLPSMKTMLLGGLNGRVPVSLEKAISYQFQGEVMRTLLKMLVVAAVAVFPFRANSRESEVYPRQVIAPQSNTH